MGVLNPVPVYVEQAHIIKTKDVIHYRDYIFSLHAEIYCMVYFKKVVKKSVNIMSNLSCFTFFSGTFSRVKR